jgi:uncharacterized protein
MIIGVISDTPELLRPEALTALRGSDRIIHAGDVGAPEVLAALAELAPVTAGALGRVAHERVDRAELRVAFTGRPA